MSLLLGSMTVAACSGDETLTGYGAAGPIWHLQEVNGDPATMPMRLTFAPSGRLQAASNCGQVTARVDAPYPWWELTELSEAPLACPAPEAHQVMVALLSQATLVEVSGTVLILSDSNGLELLFRAAE